MDKDKRFVFFLTLFILIILVVIVGKLFIQPICCGPNYVDSIDNQIQEQLQKMFANNNTKIAVYPAARKVIIRMGEPGGFAFQIKNLNNSSANFSYVISAEDSSNCGSNFGIQDADRLLIERQGDIGLLYQDGMSEVKLIRFDVPSPSPPCTISYKLNIEANSIPYDETHVWLTIK